MNPLQEYPNLFANGEFKVEIHWAKDKKPVEIFTAQKLPIVNHYPEHCTLIARPIEDMTDEEIEYLGWDILDNRDAIEWIKDHCNPLTMDGQMLIDLLSIGIYPFDHQHFEDGTVIDSRTI